MIDTQAITRMMRGIRPLPWQRTILATITDVDQFGFDELGQSRHFMFVYLQGEGEAAGMSESLRIEMTADTGSDISPIIATLTAALGLLTGTTCLDHLVGKQVQAFVDEDGVVQMVGRTEGGLWLFPYIVAGALTVDAITAAHLNADEITAAHANSTYYS